MVKLTSKLLVLRFQLTLRLLLTGIGCKERKWFQREENREIKAYRAQYSWSDSSLLEPKWLR